MQVSVKSDFDRLTRGLSALERSQLPFATARALNDVAEQAQQVLQARMPEVFDNPTPYTIKGVRVWRATKSRLEAKVGYRDAFGRGTDAAMYLGPEVDGGARRHKRFEGALRAAGLLPAGMFCVPGDAALLDGYGNMRPSQIVQILSWFKSLRDTADWMSDKRKGNLKKGSTKRGARGMAYFIAGPGGPAAHLPAGIWQRTQTGFGWAIKPVLLFVSAPTYETRLPFQQIIEDTVRRQLPARFRKRMDEAIASAFRR